MDLLHLRYFLTVAHYEHMTRAAEHLRVAQPALTQSIHRLETELGTALFERRGRNIALTDTGRWLRDEAAPLVDALEDLPARLREHVRLQDRTIRIRVSAATVLVTEAIIHFKSLHPEVEFHLMRAMDEQHCDILVTTALNAAEHPGSRVFEEEIVLGVSQNAPMAEQGTVELRNLREKSFISLAPSTPLRMICDGFCREAGFRPHIVVESDSPTAVRNLIAAGMGIGFWPACSWGGIAQGHIALLPVSDVRCCRDIVITRRFASDSPLHEAFWTYLQDELTRATARR